MILGEYRNASASTGDDYLVCVEESVDRIDLHDALRLRCSDDPSVSTLDFGHVVALFFLGLSLFLCQKPANDLCRAVKCLVIRVYRNLGKHRGYRLVDSLIYQCAAYRALQVVPDVSLAHGRADTHRSVCVLRILL